MTARQRIVRVRREYNQWVGNQTLEDYALRFTAKTARRWSSLRVANAALGAISFLALEAIGGTITLSYGFSNAAAAIIAVGALIFATGLPISYYAARYGVDIDLLTRGAGFGYIGSTLTSLIYASFTFIFFAIEAVIMSTALEMCLGVPLTVGYLISSLVVIPLVTHGITFISRFQLWSQPIWVVMQVLPFLFIGAHSLHSFADWQHFPGRVDAEAATFDVLLFGAAGSVVFSLIAQIGEQVDFLRFLPQREKRGAGWWAALLCAGPGWTALGCAKLLAGSFLAFLAVEAGLPYERAGEPIAMYRVAYQFVFASPTAAMMVAGFFVIVSQLKINVTNSYAGSIAWSNFFSRLTHSHPGRVVWLVFNVAIALLLMELGVYTALERVLGLYSTVAAAWVGALVADLVINKPLRLSPPYIEFKRAHLYDINPVGVGSMLVALAVSSTAYCGGLGPALQAFTPFVAFFVAFAMAPLIASATRGRYYIARKPRRHWAEGAALRCCICEHEFEPEDMAFCPAYSGPICSLCCSLDARCHDSCKPFARFSSQLLAFLGSLLPGPVVARLNSRLGHYLGVFAVLGGVIGGVLSIVYVQTALGPAAPHALIAGAFWKIFFILIVIVGIAAWLFVLAEESRRVAEEESRRQTTLLMQEIKAHQRTDAKLQKAKEAAEAANLAKTRYLVGMSHELRTPLNAVLGYAQLLQHDAAIPEHRRHAIRTIQRSTEHLSGLIDGLLDISKIEAGRLHLQRDEVRIVEFLDQIVDMFRLQATAKGIDFEFDMADPLPPAIHVDARRFRQILINLLSNAIKFTRRGRVALRVRYRGEVAEFEVEDTGIGIAPENLGRIFEPFERIELPAADAAPGTGLGLTITKLLTEIMGGEISVASEYGTGSTFRVKLHLAEVTSPRTTVIEKPVRGYAGRRRTVLVVDDNPVHRDVMHDILAPLGFIVFSAADGPGCLQLAGQCKPDLFLLDISMPGPGGIEVAKRLRESGHRRAVIVMISAIASDTQRSHAAEPYDDYLIKPIDVRVLLQRIGGLLKLEWTHEAAAPPPGRTSFSRAEVPPRRHIDDLRQLGQIGYVRGIQAKLTEIESEAPGHRAFVAEMRTLVENCEMTRYMAALEGLAGDDP